ncbi:3-deoxy-manno-octulosonate cytidylyltransferase [Rhodoblastus acidophilus]|uniref:3-deoxy-manno-octulosonate cytidylyltransferase n=1 Tax=Candidatus Rhodoblastus alkanivorans TaxID=2954117 RepID=A0ABS9Z353_9HYPH|nr:3-deoxy-manno-octulosonate cytidylyltransferase [Candidatus Rhodoblastus alkanivorans]MCI4677511.1 3-deoxy-manno-octulosonate cytidylyltransferase [Candidatus Rhodoblastus alkanivorans]MCI4681870.1 3-deoxy-manno-octulosonate cytidylyltransferase [Candidatus Rhodoblastus alkanivorans]MDI4642920.1 3-deoxy-manno-octulosonate cytidylyltransferase [Rhodoblastus acidophilus]
MPTEVLTVIPARLASTRLPDKPLAELCGAPMIVQVWRRAVEAGIGPVLVAADGPEIAAAIRRAGGEAVVTDPGLPSGSDRIAAALQIHDPDRRFGVIVNLQGDLPTIDPGSVRAALAPLADNSVEIATLAARIARDEERTNPNVVKAVGSPLSPTRMRALYFTRATAPWGEGDLYHHIGLYAFRRAALERFVALAPSALEKREKLEQLRALEAGMRIDVEIVETVPLGVDTPEDLARARQILMSRK